MTDLHKQLMCTACFIAIAFGGMYLVEGPVGQYVITDKKDGQITYRDLNGRNTHVMNFDADTAGIGFDVYSHVNIGDTISGHARTLRKPMARTWYSRDGKLTEKTSSVYAINGTDIRNIQLKARYASWLREMKQKQK